MKTSTTIVEQEQMNKAVTSALSATSKRVIDCFAKSKFNTPSSSTSVYSSPPQLVAVSKTKPVHLLQACYDAGHRHFGENYVQEIIEKVPQMSKDIKWHFIGPIQSNKVNNLINKTWPHLHVIETVGSLKLANKLENAVGRVIKDPSLAKLSADTEGSSQTEPRTDPMRVLLQINTSGETQKSGVAPGEEAVALAQHVVNEVSWCGKLGLFFVGVMTEKKKIGC